MSVIKTRLFLDMNTIDLE